MLCAPSPEELNSWIAALAPGGESTKGAAAESEGGAQFSSSGPLVEVHSGWMKKKGQVIRRDIAEIYDRDG